MNRRVVLLALAVFLVACNINPNIDTSAMTEGFDKCVEKIAHMELLPPELVALAVASIGDQQQCEETVKVVNVCDQKTDQSSDSIVIYDNDDTTPDTVTICVPIDPNCYDAYYDEQSKTCAQVDNGQCDWDKKLDVLCDDGEFCTKDYFDNGQCRHLNVCSQDDILCPPERVAACDDQNPCTQDTCNPVSGACQYQIISNDSACPTTYNQDGTCVFQLASRNHVMVEAFDDLAQFLYGAIDLYIDQETNLDYYDSLQMRMGSNRVMGLGEFSGIPTIISAYKNCYHPKDPVNVLVAGSQQCAQNALPYPDGTQGVNVTYQEHAFQPEYYTDVLGLNSTYDAARYYQKNFDVVVVCDDFLGYDNNFDNLTAEEIRVMLLGDEAIDLAIIAVAGIAQEYQPSSMPIDYGQLRDWRLLNVAAGRLGLNFDFLIRYVGTDGQPMTARMKLK